MAISRFLFGRVNIIAHYENKRDFVYRGLQDHQLLKVRDHLWGFFDVEEVSEYPNFVTGYLAKVRPHQPEEIGDLETHEIAITNVANRAIAKSRFFLEIPTGLVAYQLISGHISQENFEEYFKTLFENAHDRFFVSVDVQTVEERASFLEALSEFERIQSITIELFPTNPHFSEIYRNIDERLKALRARKYREQISAGKDGPGLQAADDDEIARKAAMAEDGYGEATARGTRDGRPAKASTRQHPISATAETRDRTPREILADIYEGFMEIMRRAAL